MPPRIVAIAPGDPFDPETFSGSSLGILGALRDRGAVAGAINGRPSWLERIEQLGSIHPVKERWRQVYNTGSSPVSPLVRTAMSRSADRRAGKLVAEHDANVVLRVTGWYRSALPGVLHASYHDGNLASYLQHADTRLDRDSAGIRRAWAWERATYDATEVIFTMSEWLRGLFVDEFGQDPAKVVAVGAGSNVPMPPEVQRSWDIPRVLLVGKHWDRKGGPELVRAWPALKAAHPDAELTVIGPTERPPELPAEATFLGRVPNGSSALADAYRAATIFIMPSKFDAFGIALLEAMAFGVPCITADRCAMPEIVADGVTGRVIDDQDNARFEAALIELADPQTARTMGAAARRHVVEHYTWDVAADRMIAELERRMA